MLDPVPPRSRPRSRRLAIATAATLIALIAAEALARLMTPSLELRRGYEWLTSTHLTQMPYQEFVRRQHAIQEARARQGMERGRGHPIFGWTYNPTFALDVDEIEIHVNSLGLRGPEVPERKEPGELRVLCLGGSTTGCEEVREAETWPARLEAWLRERIPERPIRVINAGVPTYDTRMSLLDYSVRLHRLEPDVVAIYHGINDLRSHARGGIRVSPAKNYTGRAMEPFVFESESRKHSLGEDLRSVLGHSRLIRLADAAWKRMRAAKPAGLAKPDAEGIEAFAAFYRALVRQIHGSGARAVPMTFQIASPGRFSREDERKVDASFGIYLSHGIHDRDVGRRIVALQNEAIRAIARDEGAPVCEVEGRVPADRDHFVDVCHFTSEGSRRVAEALGASVAPLLESRGEGRFAPAGHRR